jgi:uncharacterized protein YoxC
MLVIEIELGIIVLVMLGLLVVLVPVLIRVGRVAKESEHVLRQLNTELPFLFQEVRQLIQRGDRAAANARRVTAGFPSFSDAVAGIGRTVTNVQVSIRRGAGPVLVGLGRNVRGWIAGARAAFRVIKRGTTFSLPPPDLLPRRDLRGSAYRRL